ncbi:MAG: hypothetical protein R3F14_09680 [Polyangiaceae bacterium]
MPRPAATCSTRASATRRRRDLRVRLLRRRARTRHRRACFDIFGKLALDEDARAPFTVRDLEGFLLLEDAFPDRRSLPTWEGAAFTTRAYETTQLSEKTWESDTKARHLAHLREAADPPPND